MKIFKDFSFDAAHRLPKVPVGHKCGNLHGHTYRVRVWLVGTVGDDTGWVIDYAEIARAWDACCGHLDHAFLNDIPGLENPTTEILSAYIFRALALNGRMPMHSVEVYESATTGCVYIGDGL